jgi:hypothetical protein
MERTEQLEVTFFARPNGRQQTNFAPCTPEVKRLGEAVRKRGYRFEGEVLTTGHVHLDCCNEDEQLSNAVCPNDESVHTEFERVVREAAQRLGINQEAGDEN